MSTRILHQGVVFLFLINSGGRRESRFCKAHIIFIRKLLHLRVAISIHSQLTNNIISACCVPRRSRSSEKREDLRREGEGEGRRREKPCSIVCICNFLQGFQVCHDPRSVNIVHIFLDILEKKKKERKIREEREKKILKKNKPGPSRIFHGHHHL